MKPSIWQPLRLEPALERRAVTFAYVALAVWSLLVIGYCWLLFWIR